MTTDGDDIDIGGNDSAEGGGAALAVDNSVETVDAIE